MPDEVDDPSDHTPINVNAGKFTRASTIVGRNRSGTIAAQGWATYLDAVTGASQDCINTQGTGSFVFSSLQPLTLRSLKGNLFVCYRGKLVQESTGGPVHLIDGTYRIIGGTVTFQGARGSGVMLGIEDLSAVLKGHGHVVLNGDITYGGIPAGQNEPDCFSL